MAFDSHLFRIWFNQMHLNQMHVQMQMRMNQMQVQMLPSQGNQMQVQVQMAHLHLHLQVHLSTNLIVALYKAIVRPHLYNIVYRHRVHISGKT